MLAMHFKWLNIIPKSNHRTFFWKLILELESFIKFSFPKTLGCINDIWFKHFLTQQCYLILKMLSTQCWIWVSHHTVPVQGSGRQCNFVLFVAAEVNWNILLRCGAGERGDKSVRKLLNPSRLCSNQLRQAQYFSSISTLSSSSVVKSLQNINIIFSKQKLSARCHHCQDCKAVYSIFASIFTVNG